MEIKENKTRISLWLNEKRFAKIEYDKLSITYGYSNKNKNLWKIFYFNKIDDCLKLLKCYLLTKNINLSFKEKQDIEKLYIKLTN